MPASKVTLKEKKLEITLTGVNFAVGGEQVTIDSFTAAIDVQDILHSVVPKHILPPTVPDEFHQVSGVKLIDFGDKKIQVIKEMSVFTRLSPKGVKDLVEDAPVFIQAGQFMCSVDEVVQKLRAVGARCDVIESKQNKVPPPQPKVLHLLQKLLVDAAGMTKDSVE